jgi:hypothetical protein
MAQRALWREGPSGALTPEAYARAASIVAHRGEAIARRVLARYALAIALAVTIVTRSFGATR